MSWLLLSLLMQAAPSGSFDWGKQWYPMAIAADLDPGRPHAVELLGQPLVGATSRCHISLSGTHDTKCTPCMLQRSSAGHQQVIKRHCRAKPEDAMVTMLHPVKGACCALHPVGALERRGGGVACIRGPLPAPPRTPLRSMIMLSSMYLAASDGFL
jgi:hypothetical protein